MNLQSKKVRKIAGILALIILVALAVVKWFFGWCSIWLCLAFVATVVAWSIIDSTTNEKPSEESPNDTTSSG